MRSSRMTEQPATRFARPLTRALSGPTMRMVVQMWIPRTKKVSLQKELEATRNSLNSLFLFTSILQNTHLSYPTFILFDSSASRVCQLYCSHLV